MPTQTSAHDVEPATRQSAPPAAAVSRWLVGEQHATVTRPFPEVVRLLHDIRSLEEFEPKADHVVVHAATSTSGTYRIRGRLGPLPWTGRFSYRLHERGFHSSSIRFRFGIEVRGGFEATAVGDDVDVRHYEHYRLPLVALPLKPWLARRLRASQMAEMAGVAAYLRAGGARRTATAPSPFR